MLAKSASENRHRDFWSELKKLDNYKKPKPCSINNCTDDTDIANVFANKYRDLYTSVPTDKHELDEICNNINMKLVVRNIRMK